MFEWVRVYLRFMCVFVNKSSFNEILGLGLGLGLLFYVI